MSMEHSKGNSEHRSEALHYGYRSYRKSRSSGKKLASPHAVETFLEMGKAKFIAAREIVIEFVF